MTCILGTGYSSYGYGYNRVASRSNMKNIASDNAAKYKDKMSDMHYYFFSGRPDLAMHLYQELFDSVKDESEKYGYDLDDETIRSSIDDSYKTYTQISLNEDMNQHCKNPFMTGLTESIPVYGWFFANSNSDEEAKAIKNNKQASASSQAGEIAGASVGTAASILGLGLASKAIASACAVTASGSLTTLGTILTATGIKGLAAGAAALIPASGGTILPLIAVAGLIGAGVVLAKNYFANKAENKQEAS